MKLRLIRIGLAFLGSAIGLLIAGLLIGGMDLDAGGFILAVLIFTVLMAVLDPLISKAAQKWAEPLEGVSALVATALALLVTIALSDGISFDGAGSFLLAAVIVWLAVLLVGVLLSRFVLRRYTPA